MSKVPAFLLCSLLSGHPAVHRRHARQLAAVARGLLRGPCARVMMPMGELPPAVQT